MNIIRKTVPTLMHNVGSGNRKLKLDKPAEMFYASNRLRN
jgi:hypothetical protein